MEAYRWRFLLSPRRKLAAYPVTLIYLVSRLANIVVPLRGGDVVQIQVESRRFRIPSAEIAATVLAVATPLNWVTLGAMLTLALAVVDVAVSPTREIAVVTTVIILGFASAVILSHSARLAARQLGWASPR